MSNKDSLILLHLPFNQHSKLDVKPGVLARDAISRILEKRNIMPEMCSVCVNDDPQSPQIDLQMDLETLAQQLEGKKELWVHSEGLKLLVSIQHKFVRKTFFNLTLCDVCHKVIRLFGYRCEHCHINFHNKCSLKVPTYCDLLENTIRDASKANELRNMCTEFGGRNAAIATDILDSLTNPGVEQPYATTNGYQTPDETTPIATEFSNDIHSTKPSCSSSSLYPQSNNRLLYPNLPRLQPSGSTSTTTPSSTCSSPVSHHLLGDLSGSSLMPLTPPQSAPPQKMTASFFSDRIRSKSPGDIRPLNASHASQSGMSLDGNSNEYHLTGSSRRLNKGRKALEEWEINASDVVYHRKIGSGSFGTVFKGTYFGNVAIKKLNVGNPGPALLKAFKNEVAVLKNTRHGNVLNFMGWIREPELAIVTQWCEGSSLYRHIHVMEPRVDFEIMTVLEIYKQISHGMSYLHSKNIIHRDLKTNNIFLTDDNTVKIGDFGLATVKTRWSAGQQSQQPTGSILWMAPEVIRKREYTTLSDVYSYGICLYEILSGLLPYDDIKNRDQIIFMVGIGKLHPNYKHLRQDTPKTLRHLLERCILFMSEKRPEFEEIGRLLDEIAQNLPKLKKSQSDTFLYRAHKSDDDYSGIHSTASPKTPKYYSPTPFFSITPNMDDRNSHGPI
uniref:Raf homolog serine/threonine-protein kinase n=1 Tax=Acrobeloides nanus TaxID=290746 RepID=A0A914BYL5_9BILA